MSPLLRCGLVAAGLVGAFAAGFFLKPVPAIRTAARPSRSPVSHTVARPPDPARVPAVHADAAIRDPQVKPATVLGAPQPARAEAIDPLEAAGMEMIRREIGHQDDDPGQGRAGPGRPGRRPQATGAHAAEDPADRVAAGGRAGPDGRADAAARPAAGCR